MRYLVNRGVVIALFMCVAAWVAVLARPTIRVADMRPKVELETLVPSKFGGWAIDQSIVPIGLSPDVAAAISQVYAQTLQRTYVNGDGERVMLSLAYGADQTDSVQIHLPEGCYQGQGFAVTDKNVGRYESRLGVFPVARLVARKANRQEPITYWVVVGDEVAVDSWGMKKAKLRYAAKKQIADGMLVRVSTISADSGAGFAIQNRFLSDLLDELSKDARDRLIGASSGAFSRE